MLFGFFRLILTVYCVHGVVNSDDGFESESFLLAEEDVLVIVSFHEVENKVVQLMISFYLST